MVSPLRQIKYLIDPKSAKERGEKSIPDIDLIDFNGRTAFHHADVELIAEAHIILRGRRRERPELLFLSLPSPQGQADNVAAVACKVVDVLFGQQLLQVAL